MIETTTTREGDTQPSTQHPDGRFGTLTVDRLVIPWPGTDKPAISMAFDCGNPIVEFLDRDGRLRMDLALDEGGAPVVALCHNGNARALLTLTDEGHADLVLGDTDAPHVRVTAGEDGGAFVRVDDGNEAGISLSASNSGYLGLLMGNVEDGPFVRAAVNRSRSFRGAEVSVRADDVTGILVSSSTDDDGRTFSSSLDLYHKEHGAARLEVDNGDPSAEIHAFGSEAGAKVKVDNMGRPELVLTDASGGERVFRGHAVADADAAPMKALARR